MALIVCPQCGRQVVSSAPLCPSCGVALATITVDATAAAPAAPDTAPALPEQDTPVVSDVSDDAAAPTTRTGIRRRPPARLLMVAGTVAVVVLLTIGTLAVLATTGRLGFITLPSPNVTGSPAPSSPTAGPPPGFGQYTDPAGLYRLYVPNDWSVETSPSTIYSGVAFRGTVSGSENDILDIVTLQGASTEQPDVIVAKFLTITSNGAPVANVSGPTAVTVAEVKWISLEGDITVKASDGGALAMHAVAQTTTYGDQTLIIVYLAPATSFAAANATYFQPMLASLQLKPA